MFKIFTISSALLLICVSPVLAEGGAINADDFLKDRKPISSETAPASTQNPVQPVKSSDIIELEKNLAAAKAELEDKEILKQKIDLARKMHEIRPTREQVDSAVLKASFSLPKYERKNFIDSMSMMLNYNAIERISVDAMIETYTLKELSSMVEYYSKPEARSASKKVMSWAMIVQPEIISMIDKALMRIKTGQ